MAIMTAQEESDVLNAVSRDLGTDGGMSRADAKAAAQAVIDWMNVAANMNLIHTDMDTATSVVLSDGIKKKVCKRALELWLKTE